MDDWSWSHFPDPEFGEWFGYLNRRGEPTHFLKGGRWKTFFHLPRCILTCMKLLEK
ncbi:MAG: AGE family epimerase/isomerase [Promethearchaeota archaeon]